MYLAVSKADILKIKNALKELNLKIDPVKKYTESQIFIYQILAYIEKFKWELFAIKKDKKQMKQITDSLFTVLSNCECLRSKNIKEKPNPQNTNFNLSLAELDKRLEAKQNESIQVGIMNSILQRFAQIQYTQTNLKEIEKDIKQCDILSRGNRSLLMKIANKINESLYGAKNRVERGGNVSEKEIRINLENQMKNQQIQKNEQLVKLRKQLQSQMKLSKEMRDFTEQMRIGYEEQIKNLKDELKRNKINATFTSNKVYAKPEKREQIIVQQGSQSNSSLTCMILEKHNKSMQDQITILRQEMTILKAKQRAQNPENKIQNIDELNEKRYKKLEQTNRILQNNNDALKKELTKTKNELSQCIKELEMFEKFKIDEKVQREELTKTKENNQRLRTLNGELQKYQKQLEQKLESFTQKLKQLNESSSGRTSQSLLRQIAQKDKSYKQIQQTLNEQLSKKNTEVAKLQTEITKIKASLNIMLQESEYSKLKARIQDLQQKYIKEIREKEQIKCELIRQKSELAELRTSIKV